MSQAPPYWTKNNSVFQVGITGGIGSGKSTICKAFVALGIPFYDADARAKDIMNLDLGLKEAVQASFGAGSYNEGGLNRPYLAKQIFGNEQETQKLNAIVHPFVANDYAKWVIENSQAPYLIKEAALLFESGSYQSVHYTINVSATAEERLLRVLSRDSFRTEEEVKNIMNRQWNEEQRAQKADFILNNAFSSVVLQTIIELNEQFSNREFQQTYGIHQPTID